MRALLLTALALTMAGCGSMSSKQRTILGDTLPGISNLDTISKSDKEDAKWWDNYYGRSSAE